jgi:hypothetical protein
VAQYEVVSVKCGSDGSPITRQWNSTKQGTMLSYRVVLKNAAGAAMENVEVSYKQSDPAPTAGMKLDGEVDTSGQYGPKFKFPYAGGGGGGGGGGRKSDPAERRSIAMQHAQKCAVTILEVAAAHGDYHPPTAADVAGQVRTIAALLWQQVMDAEADKITTGGS